MSDANATRGEIITPAVARIADDTALMRELVARRWPQIADALRAGATQAEVAAAAGLDLAQLRQELIRWASERARAGELCVNEHAELVHCVLGLPE